ncbi:unnamed protein product, partial [Prorocentrum cordatum]
MTQNGMDPTLPSKEQMTKVSMWFSTALRHSPYYKDKHNRYFEKVSTFDPYDGWVVVDDLLTNWTENDQYKHYREMHEVLIKGTFFPDEDGMPCISFMLDIGSNVNIIGANTARTFQEVMARYNHRPAICTLSKTLYINGVGEGAAICRKMGNFKIGVQYANEASPRIEEYASNIAEGSGANLPAIWGLSAMEARDTIIVLKPGFQKVIFPSGEYTLKLGKGAKVLRAKKTPSADETQFPGWQTVIEFPFLGHAITANSSAVTSIHNTKKAVWKAFLANAGAASVSKVPLKVKLRLISRTCLTPFAYRCSRWPRRAEQLAMADRMQTRLVAAAVRMRKGPGDSAESFAKRVNARAALQAREFGRWPTSWRKRVVDWDSHIKRAHCQQQWSTRFVLWRDGRWLQARRDQHRRGRPRTRVCLGQPAARWGEGVALATAKLQQN